MWGHNHWIGSEKGCESTRAPLSITLTDRYRRTMKPNLVSALAPFELDYRIVFAKHQSAWQVEIKFQSEVSPRGVPGYCYSTWLFPCSRLIHLPATRTYCTLGSVYRGPAATTSCTT